MKKILIVLASMFCLSVGFAGHHGHHAPPPPHYHHHSWNGWSGALAVLGTAAIISSFQKKEKPQYVVIQDPKNKIVYWCESEREFYPKVRACPTGWIPKEVP